MSRQRTALIALSLLLLAAPVIGWGQTRPPIFADFVATNVAQSKAGAREVITYRHECLTQWGYEPGTSNRPFVVMGAAKASPHPPMIVYLHGAGGHAAGYIFNVPEPSVIGPEFVLLSIDCADARGPDGWYGWHWARKDPPRYVNVYSPPEHRCLATIEWVAHKYEIDRNRIYLCGHSMGGSGTLGLGMARGDIFAALWAGVPAGVEHAWFRMGFPTNSQVQGWSSNAVALSAADLKRFSGIGLPDVPPVINFSSPIDGWAAGQENLLRAMHDGRHLLVFAWAPFGHTQDYKTANPAVLAYPWLSIRRDQAYPAFTDASTDRKYPGFKSKGPDQDGQINAYFRWKNVADTAQEFAMELWLLDGKSLSTPIEVPESSIVDVTPRRLQQFKVAAGKTYGWRLTEQEKTTQTGEAAADDIGILTIRRLTLRSQPQRLTILAAK